MSGQGWDEWARATLGALLSATAPQANQGREELTRRAELAEAELARVTEQDDTNQREAIAWIMWADDVARLPRVRSALQSGETYRAHIALLLEHAREAKQAAQPQVARRWAVMVDGATETLWQGWQADEQAARLAWLDSPKCWRYVRAVLEVATDVDEKLAQIRKAIVVASSNDHDGPFVTPTGAVIGQLCDASGGTDGAR